MKKRVSTFLGWVVLFCIVVLPSARLSAEEETVAKTVQPDGEKAARTFEAETQSAQTQSVQKDVDARADDEVGAKRKQVLKEAVGAVRETRAALEALEKNKTDEALVALEKVTGKLALIVAREPELALAPVSVAVVTYDLYASPETVRQRVKAAEECLDDGAVQSARDILSMLASEIRIETTHIPLATYPEAIKAIVPLIDEGRIEEARMDLQLALNTLVITEEIIPLPMVRARALLLAAEKFAEDDDRSDKQAEELAGMLDAARNQVKLSQALGYGDKKMYKSIYEEIKLIKQKVEGGKSGTGFFDTVKEKLEDF